LSTPIDTLLSSSEEHREEQKEEKKEEDQQEDVATNAVPRAEPANVAVPKAQLANLAVTCRVEEVSATLVSIASFHVKKVFFGINGSDLILTVNELLMSDRRPDKSEAFGEVISKRVNPKTKGSFRSTSTEPVVRCEMITLNPLRIILILPCLVQLNDFQSRTMVKLNAALAKLKKHQAASKLRSDSDAPNNAGAAETITTANVTVKGLEVFAIEDMKNPRSRALVAGCSGSLSLKMIGNTGLDVDVEIEAFVLNRVLSMSSGAFASILNPWRLGVTLNSVTNRLMRVDAVFSLLDIVFSHGDYLLINAMYVHAMNAFSADSAARLEQERIKRESAVPVVGKIVLEPPRDHREASMQYLLLAAEPISLLVREAGSSRVWLSVASDGTRLCLSPKRDLWLFEKGKLVLGTDHETGVVYDEETKTVSVKKGVPLSDWVFTNGMIRLASTSDWVLTAVGDWIELRQVELDTINQMWVVGDDEQGPQQQVTFCGFCFFF
jgi:hypothetical protein